mgnify:CR=1 FL=1
MRSVLIALAVAVGCHPGEFPADSADDTGVVAIAPHAPTGAVGRMIGYLSHSIGENRLWAARGLAISGDPRATSFLRERQRVESDEQVCAALAAALTSLGSGSDA